MELLRKRTWIVILILIICILLRVYFDGQEFLTQLSEEYPHSKINTSKYRIAVATEVSAPSNSTSFDALWKTTAGISSFHKQYDVDCAALVNGESHAISQTNLMIKKIRLGPGIDVPSDVDVIKLTTNCEDFKLQRDYPSRARSEEELDFPIAYTILAHTTSAQVERLLRAIYQPQNVYCIHPDANASPDFIAAIFSLANCFPNVFIPSKLERVQYRGITRLLADINCMKGLLTLPVQWKYVINLCGQDFPLKTNLEIVRQLKAFNGMNEIESVAPTPNKALRTKYKFKFRPGYLSPVNTGIENSPPPHGMTIYTGNAYGAFVRSFVDFMINDEEAIDLLNWMEDTWSPDENYWATLHQHPRATPVWRKGPTKRLLVRMMKWGDSDEHPPCQGKWVRGLCIFAVGYLHHLTEVPHLFANKFHYDYDPVCLQCLEQLLDFRTKFPQTLSKFVKNFPVTGR